MTFDRVTLNQVTSDKLILIVCLLYPENMLLKYKYEHLRNSEGHPRPNFLKVFI